MKEHNDDRCREVGGFVYPIPIPEAQLPAGKPAASFRPGRSLKYFATAGECSVH
jgi:hypothetical protein